MKASEERHTNGVTSFNRVVGRQRVSFPPRRRVKLAARGTRETHQRTEGRKEERPGGLKTPGARFQQLATNKRRERVRDARPRARGPVGPRVPSRVRRFEFRLSPDSRSESAR